MPSTFKSNCDLLVSVVMCVFNGANQVESAIDDILGQTYTNFELIISDDASTDDTLRVLERYAEDSRVRIFRQPTNLGFLANKNFAIAKSRGALITQQDHDDRCDRRRIARQVEALKNNGLSVVACGVRRIDIEGREVARIAPTKDIVLFQTPADGLPFFFPPLMFSREVWLEHGPFNSYFAGAFGEDNYFVSCVMRTHAVFVIADCLYDYVDSPNSVTSKLHSKRALAMLPILRHLATQNRELGTNDLEQNNFDALDNFENAIIHDKRYISQQYRTFAARAIDHDNLSEGARLILKSLLLDPISFQTIKTLSYLLRRVARIR